MLIDAVFLRDLIKQTVPGDLNYKIMSTKLN